ncbi:DMSO/TMAO reductase YedYZ molybdopterin-dependent catalytic subunit [Spinactinospora alkalitolerans]|uniref:DMSO/TMAO reductase YedYZ molybdopterin-dependent catalytic subunit n=1 Tax=Spinactinospora alkalitolerans TaxID=687207 RepID=A0A852U124_9ACTN|nr:molybdopterin-dependent oxidoreductase [Spinactinospora alkalitolerans]NYE47700.1 DMSO/TMAO reductase YedYZ molybdopterin-dependent catalytic subunit [Spinactinospora alkalitolerans]
MVNAADGGARSLPPGQRQAPLRRFGLPEFAAVRPVVPDRPVVRVGGAVRGPTQIPVGELMALPGRREARSDLHCVTTWSATGLTWGGVPFRAVHESLVQRVAAHPRCSWVVFVGLDGYRGCLRLDDALSEDVLLADTLDGVPLTVERGAPLRLVAPAHYGYKSVRHVCAVEYRLRHASGSAGWAEHPRGRVRREERSRILPGRVWRPLWRMQVAPVRRRYARYAGSEWRPRGGRYGGV